MNYTRTFHAHKEFEVLEDLLLTTDKIKQKLI